MARFAVDVYGVVLLRIPSCRGVSETKAALELLLFSSSCSEERNIPRTSYSSEKREPIERA